MKDSIEALQSSYKTRVESFISEGKKCDSPYLRGKILKNLYVSNLIQENLRYKKWLCNCVK